MSDTGITREALEDWEDSLREGIYGDDRMTGKEREAAFSALGSLVAYALAEHIAREEAVAALEAAVVDGMQTEILTGALGPSISTDAGFKKEVVARMAAFKQVAVARAVKGDAL